MGIKLAVGIAASCVTTFFCHQEANATSGAELLQMDERFGVAFIRGAASYMMTDFTMDPALNRLTFHRQSCFSNSKIQAGTLYDAVVQEIRSDPENLAEDATSALRKVTYKICGAPPKTD
jgi:hypothetical protein